jgi:hypothetical protein
MTDQVSPTRMVPLGAVRNELWEARHLVASLRVEIQRADEAYAALGATLAAHQAEHRRALAEVASLTADLHDARSAHALEVQAHIACAAAGEASRVEHERTRAERDDARRSALHASEQVRLLAADRDALLQTRTYRWTRPGRAVWGWLRARTAA